jgi:hypothetical protein
MNEPRRMSEEDPVSAALLGAARRWQPPESMRRRTLQALGIPLALGLASVAPAGAVVGVKVWIVTCAVAVTASGGFVAYQVTKQPAQPRHAVVVRAPAVHRQVPTPAMPAPVPAPPAAPAPVELAPVLPHRLSVAVAARPVRLATRMDTPREPDHVAAAISAIPAIPALAPLREPALLPPVLPPPPPRPAPLAGELNLLDVAERAVRSRSFDRAFGYLDEYQRLFPNGALQEETAVLRMTALLGTGDRSGAGILGTRFLAENPHSVLAKRVRAMLNR